MMKTVLRFTRPFTHAIWILLLLSSHTGFQFAWAASSASTAIGPDLRVEPTALTFVRPAGGQAADAPRAADRGFPEDAQSKSGPRPPAGNDPGLLIVRAASSSVVISGVPAYIWHHGCGPTAAGMLLGYWDAHGFDNLVPGDASTQTAGVDEMIASSEHYDDYSLPIDAYPTLLPDLSEDPPGDEHASNSVADFMRTSMSYYNNYYGWSWYSDMDDALVAYTSLVEPGYAAVAVNQFWGVFTWDSYKAEIDAGRPVVLLVDSDGDGSTDHFVTALGYNEDGAVRQYAIHDTWDTNIHWYSFRPMSSSYSWGIYGATLFQIEKLDNLFLYNDGDQDLQVTSISAGQESSWLSLSTHSSFPLVIPPGGAQTAQVSVDVTGLVPGTYTDTLTITSNDPDENPYPGGVLVTLVYQPDCYALSTTVVPEGSAALAVSPAPNCPDGKYVDGTVVTLTGTAAPGFSFHHWSAPYTNSGNPLALQMHQDLAASVYYGNNPATVLLVDDDDNNPDVLPAYAQALDSLEVPYQVWDTRNSDDEPPLEVLQDHPAIVWFTGAAYGGTAGPGASGEADLAGYLDGGGCLLLSSQDYHYDRGLTGFMSGYLGIEAMDDDLTQHVITGTGSLYGAYGTVTLDYPFGNYADRLTPQQGADAVFAGNNGTAAVALAGEAFKTSLWGFPWEALPSLERRASALDVFLKWCQPLDASSLKISEVQPGAQGAVEIFNPVTQTVSLSGVRLKIAGASNLYTQEYAFPSGFSLGPQSRLVVHAGDGSATAFHLYLGQNLAWGADGAAALVYASSGVDFVRFGLSSAAPPDGTGWTGPNPPAPPSGESLGRAASGHDSDRGDDWCRQVSTLGTPNGPCLPACEQPGAVTLLAPADNQFISDRTPDFSWSTDPLAGEYKIQVGPQADFASPTWEAVLDESTATPQNPLAETRYVWRVRAHNTAANCDAWGVWSALGAFTVDVTPPAAPLLLAPADQATLTGPAFDLSWENVSGASSYELQVDDRPDFSSPEVSASTDLDLYALEITLPEGDYFWRVRARDAAANLWPWSDAYVFTLDLSRTVYLPVVLKLRR